MLDISCLTLNILCLFTRWRKKVRTHESGTEHQGEGCGCSTGERASDVKIIFTIPVTWETPDRTSREIVVKTAIFNFVIFMFLLAI
jgi:hypothetical protein